MKGLARNLVPVLAYAFALVSPVVGTPVLIGTDGGGDAKGIYLADFDSEDGQLGAAKLVAEVSAPGFLALHPSRPIVYAACREFVAGYRYAPDGSLREINRLEVGGSGACHLAVHPSGKALTTANYGDGTVSAIRIGSDGQLIGPAEVARHSGRGTHPQRQTGPHAHGVHYHGPLLLVPDLGVDRIYAYRHDPSAEVQLSPARPSFTATQPGDGPRHLAFHPDGRHAFVIHELSNVLEAFRLADDRLQHLARASTLPAGWEGPNTCAEVVAHPNGRWVFGSNRGHDSIALFDFDPERESLERRAIVPCGVRVPRHFTLDPTGDWLLVAGQESNDIAVLRLDPTTGVLESTRTRIPVPRPICLLFLPGNR